MNTVTTQPADMEVRIRPNQGWFAIDWKGLHDYRDLLYLLVRRDFVSKYQQTILGPLWFIINPLITTVVFTVVFGRIVGIQPDGNTPSGLFYLSGLLAWNYFSGVLGSTSNTFTGNAHLFGKVYFPRLVVPLALAVSNVFSFFIQLFTFGLLYGYYIFTGAAGDAHVTSYVLLVPLLLVHMAALGLGVGMILSALTAKYRDFHHLAGFLVNLWMYGTPIIYPLSQLLEKIPQGWGWIAAVNPMTMVVEGIRYAFMGAATFDMRYYLLSLGISCIIFFVGLMLFQRTSRTFVDTV
jgi:lipopolysaccharide transport system permease protein